MPSAQKSDEHWAQAYVNAMYEACIELLEKPHPLMPAVDYFEYRLGTVGYHYGIHAWKDTLDELERLRTLLTDLVATTDLRKAPQSVKDRIRREVKGETDAS